MPHSRILQTLHRQSSHSIQLTGLNFGHYHTACSMVFSQAEIRADCKDMLKQQLKSLIYSDSFALPIQGAIISGNKS
eukprot:c17752_g1_i1 orf=308-538(+)